MYIDANKAYEQIFNAANNYVGTGDVNDYAEYIKGMTAAAEIIKQMAEAEGFVCLKELL